MASVSGTAGRFVPRAVAAGIRDRLEHTHERVSLRPQKGAAQLREAYKACTSAFSKARAGRKALRGFWLAVAQSQASCTQKMSLSHDEFRTTWLTD